jgi:Ca2+-binding RTX toxin-like protein
MLRPSRPRIRAKINRAEAQRVNPFGSLSSEEKKSLFLCGQAEAISNCPGLGPTGAVKAGIGAAFVASRENTTMKSSTGASALLSNDPLANHAPTTTRVTFTSSEVGDGLNNDSGDLAGQDGHAAVRLQNQDGSGTLIGSEIRVGDEGLHLVATDGSYFDVRDLVSGAPRGSTFSTVHLGTSGVDDFLGGDLNDYLNGGMGADQLQGGLGDDFLVGGAGDDVLTGAAGADAFIGGLGNDNVDGGVGVDSVSYASSTAGATIRLNGGATADGLGGTDTLQGIENATGSDFADTILGNGLANTLTGGLGADYLMGLNGNDTLVGGAGAANALQGGAGDDVYVVTANDTITEFAGEGTDLVQTTNASQRLTANVENLAFIGEGQFTGVGNALDNTIFGGVSRDTLIGLAGNDTLAGGSGVANQLHGGAGDDIYIVSANDTIVEVAGEGVDAVITTNSRLTLAANVENLDFTGTGDFTGFGNAGANVLRGGEGSDTLTGRQGDDTLIGDLGDDVAVFSGVRTDYTVGVTLDGYQVTDNTAGRDGVDQLIGIERIRFSDGETVALADLFPVTQAQFAALKDGGPQTMPAWDDDAFALKSDVSFFNASDVSTSAPDAYAPVNFHDDAWA